jgi:hypothetical protein
MSLGPYTWRRWREDALLAPGEVRGERGREPAGEVVEGAVHGLLAECGQRVGADPFGRAGGQAAFQQRAEPGVVTVQPRRSLGGVGDLGGDGEGAAVAVGVPAGGRDRRDQTEREDVRRRADALAQRVLGRYRSR